MTARKVTCADVRRLPGWLVVDRRAWTSLLALASLWGASYLFIKVALEDLSPGMVIFGRLALAALVLLPLARSRHALAPLREHWRAIVPVTFLQVVIPFTLITLGEQRIDSGLTGILIASSPIFVALLAIRFAPGERARGWGLVGVLVGIAGVAALFGLDLTGDTDTVIGGAMMLGAAFTYAMSPLYTRRRLSEVPSLTIATTTVTMAALLTAPWGLATLPSQAPGIDTLASMLALGIGGTGIAFALFFGLVAKVGAARAAVVSYLAPGFSVLYGALILDEAVTVGTGLGLALILAGSYLAGQGKPPWRRRRRVASDVRIVVAER